MVMMKGEVVKQQALLTHQFEVTVRASTEPATWKSNKQCYELSNYEVYNQNNVHGTEKLLMNPWIESSKNGDISHVRVEEFCHDHFNATRNFREYMFKESQFDCNLLTWDCTADQALGLLVGFEINLERHGHMVHNDRRCMHWPSWTLWGLLQPSYPSGSSLQT